MVYSVGVICSLLLFMVIGNFWSSFRSLASPPRPSWITDILFLLLFYATPYLGTLA